MLCRAYRAQTKPSTPMKAALCKPPANALAEQLRGTVGGFKIGSRLFTIEGPSLVTTLANRGDRVFLDLKYHDIPTVVAESVRAAGRLGAWMLTVHTAGGEAMLTGAAEAAAARANADQRRYEHARH